jgi:hypothetical protein
MSKEAVVYIIQNDDARYISDAIGIHSNRGLQRERDHTCKRKMPKYNPLLDTSIHFNLVPLIF